MKILPILEAPAPSKFLSFEKERITPKVVDITISQKKLEVRLYFCRLAKLVNMKGAILSAIR